MLPNSGLMQCHTVSKEFEPVLETYYTLSGQKMSNGFCFSGEAATLRLKLGPLASSSQL